MKKHEFFYELLSKKMTRKQFLVYVGVLFLTITGISRILKIISDPNLASSRSKTEKGFGSHPYGK